MHPSPGRACRTDPRSTQDASEAGEAGSPASLVPSAPAHFPPNPISMAQAFSITQAQPPEPSRPSPRETLSKAKLPPGFRVSVACRADASPLSPPCLPPHQPPSSLGWGGRSYGLPAVGLSATSAWVAMRRGEEAGSPPEALSPQKTSVKGPQRERRRLPEDTAQGALSWGGASAGRPRARDGDWDGEQDGENGLDGGSGRRDKGARSCKGEQAVAEGPKGEEPHHPPYCTEVNNQRWPVLRAAHVCLLTPPFLHIVPVPLHTDMPGQMAQAVWWQAGRAGAQGKA